MLTKSAKEISMLHRRKFLQSSCLAPLVFTLLPQIKTHNISTKKIISAVNNRITWGCVTCDEFAPLGYVTRNLLLDVIHDTSCEKRSLDYILIPTDIPTEVPYFTKIRRVQIIPDIRLNKNGKLDKFYEDCWKAGTHSFVEKTKYVPNGHKHQDIRMVIGLSNNLTSCVIGSC